MIQIKFSTDNASFDYEFSKAVNHALLQIQNAANEVEKTDLLDQTNVRYPAKYTIFDVNGNSIGYVKFTK
jgi:hypothetical protein